MTPEPRTQGLEEVRAAPNDLTGQVSNVNTAGSTARNPREAHHSVFVAIPLQQGQDVVARCNGKWRDAVVVRPQRRKGRVGVVDTETWTEHQVTLNDVAIRASLAHALRRTPKANAAGAARAAAMRAKVAMIAASAKARASAAAAAAIAAATNNAPAPAVPDKPSPAAPSGRMPPPSAPTLVLERNLCRPDEAGLDRAVMEKTDEALHAKVLKGELPGVVNVVYRRGMLAHFDCFGHADLERKTPMRADSIVRLYSMTKSVVSVGIAILMEEGLLQLEDPVAKYIPSFAHVQVKLEDGTLEPIDKPITLLHLLTHTSGLGSGPMLGSDADGDAEERFVPLIQRSTLGRTDPSHPDAVASLAHWCDELAKVPLLSHPGTEWYYSYSHDVIGRVLEVISGKRLDVFLQERILGPLGMADTSFEVPPEKWDRVAGMYRRFEVEETPAAEGEAKEAAPAEGTGNEASEAADGGESEKEAPPATYELRRLDSPSVETNEWVTGNLNPIFSGGGSVDALTGGLVSTAADYARFCLMLLRKGEIDGVRLLRPETVALITSNLLPRATGRDDVWAFGNAGMGFGLIGAVSVPHPDLDPALRPPEYGWGGMAGTAWTNDPREDFFLLSFSLTAFDLTTEEELRAGVRAAIASYNAAQAPSEPRRRRTSKRPESQTSPAAVPAAKRLGLAASPSAASPGPSPGAEADSAKKAGKRPRAATTPKKEQQEASPPKRRAAPRREELQRQATPLRPQRSSEEAAEQQPPRRRSSSGPKAKPQPQRAQSVPPRERLAGSANQAVGNPQPGAAHAAAPPQSPAPVRRRASVGGNSRGGGDTTPASAASPAAGSSTPRERRVRARLTGSPAPRACAVNDA